MYENLRGRVSRIISAGVSAVIGAVEGLSPEAVMEEAIGEVNEAVQDVKDELGRVLASKHMANKRLSEKNARYDELDGKIALAVGEGRDDLAEAGIAHQLDIEAQLPVLKETLDDLDKKEGELNSYISALNAKKREMQDELAKLRAAKAASTRPESAAAGDPDAASGGKNIGEVDRKVSRAASAFERLLARETGLPRNDSASLTDQAKLAELDKLNRENRIKERLMAVKAARKE